MMMMMRRRRRRRRRGRQWWWWYHDVDENNDSCHCDDSNNNDDSDNSENSDDDDDDDDGMMGCISNKSGNIWSNTCSPTLITLMITTTILTTYVVTWWLFKTTTLMANHNISLIIYNHYFLSTSLPCLSLKCVVRTSAPQKFLQLQSQGLFQVRTRREWWLKPWFKNGGNPWNSGKVKASEMVAEHMVQPSMGWWNWDDLWILGCVSW